MKVQLPYNEILPIHEIYGEINYLTDMGCINYNPTYDIIDKIALVGKKEFFLRKDIIKPIIKR